MEPLQYKNLLDQVAAINTRYKKINELTGENFNVFRILKVESSEVRMHSAFIAELLNPKGSHGQKDTFLKLFVEIFCFKSNPIDTASCEVTVEEHIGSISEDKTQGGRIDIVIKDKHHHHIIIENKIYAGDQEHQLTRYFNYSNQADIIYLTLKGSPPSNHSKGIMEDGIHYKCYSYKRDILKWLELSRKEVTVYPIVREAITHYINLVKYLTNQTLNRNMQEELSDLLKSHIEAAWIISNNLDKACQKAANFFCEKMEKTFEHDQLISKCSIDFNKKYSGLSVQRPEWTCFKINFQFQNYDKEMRYGFSMINAPLNLSASPEIFDKLKDLPNNTLLANAKWPWYRQLESPYDDWSKLPAWRAIHEEKMERVIIEKTHYLLGLVGDAKL